MMRSAARETTSHSSQPPKFVALTQTNWEKDKSSIAGSSQPMRSAPRGGFADMAGTLQSAATRVKSANIRHHAGGTPGRYRDRPRDQGGAARPPRRPRRA